MTGDRIVAYRNPSLSADSMFALSLVVLPQKLNNASSGNNDERNSIRWIVQIQAAMAGPQNGDFDGDCIMLQSVMAGNFAHDGGTSFDYLAMAEMDLLKPETCLEMTGLALGVIHDGLVACAQLCRWRRLPSVFEAFDSSHGEEIDMATINGLCEAALNGPRISSPVRKIAHAGKASTIPTPLLQEHVGRYVLSHVFPDELYFSCGNGAEKLEIIGGVLRQGILGKAHIGPNGSLIRHMVRNYGGARAMRLIECIHVLAVALNQVFPLTFGRDCYEAQSLARAEALEDKWEAEACIARAILANSLPTSGGNRDASVARTIDGAMGGFLGNLTERLKRSGMLSAAQNNAYADILTAKSSLSHAAQAFLGNGAQPLGRSITHGHCPIMGWSNRPLSNSLRPRDIVTIKARGQELSRNNTLAILQAHGFVSESFYEGLSLASAALCAPNGRQALLDTALLTGEIGGLEKSLHVLMAGLLVCYGGALKIVGGLQDVFTGLSSFGGGNWLSASCSREHLSQKWPQTCVHCKSEVYSIAKEEESIVLEESVMLPFSPKDVAFEVRERAAKIPPQALRQFPPLTCDIVLQCIARVCERMQSAASFMMSPKKARAIMLQNWLPLAHSETNCIVPEVIWRRAFEHNIMRPLEQAIVPGGFSQGVDIVCRLVKIVQQAALNTFHAVQGSDASASVMGGASALKHIFSVPDKPQSQEISVMLSDKFCHALLQTLKLPIAWICRALEAYAKLSAAERAIDCAAGLGTFFKPVGELSVGNLRILPAKDWATSQRIVMRFSRANASTARLPRLTHVARVMAPFVRRDSWFTDNVVDMQGTMGMMMAEHLFRVRLATLHTGIAAADVELFARVMFVTGRCAPASRYGFGERKLTQGFLEQVIFSQPCTRLVQAALNGEVDSGRSLTSAAACGTGLIAGGTGFMGTELIWRQVQAPKQVLQEQQKAKPVVAQFVSELEAVSDRSNTIVWIPQKVRNDRLVPNSLSTIEATLESVAEQASIATLCARLCQLFPALGAEVLARTNPQQNSSNAKDLGASAKKGRKRTAAVLEQ